MNRHSIYREFGSEDVSDYRDLCRVHIDIALTEDVRELKAVNLGAYYDTIFDLALDFSLLYGATIEEAVWNASALCEEY
jgi:hypothetical protein